MPSTNHHCRYKPEIKPVPDAKQIKLSFEFFPPNSTEQSLRLWRAVERLAPLGPEFMSVTFGAGGATRDRTLAAIQTILHRANVPVAGHLTCVSASRAETLSVARAYKALGVTSIVALRGDPPKGTDAFEAHAHGFASGDALVAALAQEIGLDISVAAYPEPHPNSQGAAQDIDYLKRKQDLGASRAITQFFFENDDYFRFRDAAAQAGVTMPIVPGILPIENFRKVAGFAKRCGASVPVWMEKAFGNCDTAEDQSLLATAICAEQCDGLRREGVDHLHFFTLNEPDLTYNICRAIGAEPVRFSMARGEGAA
jgi:methylenetetrahydrofolate reductase (NADPH)